MFALGSRVIIKLNQHHMQNTNMTDVWHPHGGVMQTYMLTVGVMQTYMLTEG